ncbi:MAG TPA: hypothetical protein VH593_28500 [Ktedonobacteraceae bacterium]|jgi:hypothetical protein
MDINITLLRSWFEPFDMLHLLRVWAVLIVLILLFGTIVATCGGYPTARQFWKVHLIVLGSICFLSGDGFLLFHIDPLLLMIALPCIAFVIQGDLGVKSQGTSLQDWWLWLRFHKRQTEPEEEEEE